ncbi:prolyl oligopeptidase family serine peptidase [Paludisphaera mucosa]|uniref:Prolyl oligopeptidase family serine peptidase n=1 Tax=Paludisphaera mucosa TaxID=3030827 RepID=A0ABT6F435_9BACT|nr:prolyl oligopeptidase family serine peptidase [Paludisphaera mucosa]MDG3002261.1 prolyl oligopeptidase family serine peptidase [Paludisphaera mucosa]
MLNRSLCLCLVLAASDPAQAQGPAEKIRPIPPPGVVVPEADRAALQARVEALGRRIDGLRKAPPFRALLPDVEVFAVAVDTALRYGEFFDLKEVAAARSLLEEGEKRAEALGRVEPPWNAATGPIVRGYVSKIDGSIQPYGLVVPKSYRPDSPHRFRLDVWCHGRGETLGEVSFLRQRMTSVGEFAPADAFVLHPYGRFCNANKFAGEVDLFEALDDVRSHYPIDDDRLIMRGFSMGGAAAWQFATHFPGVWAAAAPGAGFAESADFLGVFREGATPPPWYEQTLWRLYDSTGYAGNLFNVPTVAYSGEKDKQKQAADLMARALRELGGQSPLQKLANGILAPELAEDGNIDLVHVIGAGAGHNYTPEARAEINRRLDSIARKGRDPVPAEVDFTTYTLRYNTSSWVQVDGLARHWERARVNAQLCSFFDGSMSMIGNDRLGPDVSTENVTALTLTVPPGYAPFDPRKAFKAQIDGDVVLAPKAGSDRSWTARFRKVDGHWILAGPDEGGLAKRHGLQGPIDDAFYDAFLMVRPTGPALNEPVDAWSKAELALALDRWRKQFRGQARVKDDKDVTEADVADCNLVLWGDPGSNAVLAKVLDRLPVKWDKDRVEIAGATHDAKTHAPILIHPNPLNPRRYVVLNSGFTYREFDDLNNARQTPKLPDFAVVDVAVPATPRGHGKVVQAGFFDESWKPRAEEPRGPARP